MNKRINVNSALIAGLLLVGLTMFTSCKDDEDDAAPAAAEVALPAPNVTTYDGELTYTPGSGLPIIADDGSATITQSGSTYTINFSDGVPSLSGLKFKNENGGYGSISGGGSFSGIAINGRSISVGVTKSGGTWAFSGSY